MRLESHQWENRLPQSILMNMLNVLYFGRSTGITACVQQFLVLVHDGCLWMGKRIPIDSMLISRITRLPYQGWNPTEEFVGKDQDCAIAESMKKNFGLTKGKRRYDINSINDQGVHFATHILTGKIMRKCWANEFPASVISLVV